MMVFIGTIFINSCKLFIKECGLCKTRNRRNFIAPHLNQIIYQKPRELFVIDLASIPYEFCNDK